VIRILEALAMARDHCARDGKSGFVNALRAGNGSPFLSS
jgi:hypothetical protein